MSLLKRIVSDQGARAAALVVLEKDAEEQKIQQYEALDEIVTAKLRSVAAEMGEELQVLTKESSFPKHYVLGDVVLEVILFESSTEDPDPSSPHLAINEFCVLLVGLDESRNILKRRVGMLSIFAYESVYETITNHHGYANFDATEVLKVRFLVRKPPS